MGGISQESERMGRKNVVTKFLSEIPKKSDIQYKTEVTEPCGRM